MAITNEQLQEKLMDVMGAIESAEPATKQLAEIKSATSGVDSSQAEIGPGRSAAGHFLIGRNRKRELRMDGNWLPNPYALAQVLSDKLDLDSLYNEDGKSADQFLSNAFKSHGKGKTLADLLGLFHQLAQAVKAPMPIAEVMNLAEAKRAAEVFDVETIRLLLPYLVPLSDEKFAGVCKRRPSGDQALPHGLQIRGN